MNITSKKILIIGASGDLGFHLLTALASQGVVIGAQCHRNKTRLLEFKKKNSKADVKIFVQDVSSEKTSRELVSKFVSWAGGIDAVVQLSGSVSSPERWETVKQKDWDRDLAVNLTGPFFLAREAMNHMKNHGGKIILSSTASASHGGGASSMAYGAAKAAVECLTKGLAREGAANNILVNAVAPGFIDTKFHKEQMKRSAKDLAKRAKLVPLKRAGEPKDVAGMILYLLSEYGDYMTGQVLSISGGDWL